jgi:hypothetical protein
MPLTAAALAPLPSAHVHLGVVDAKGFDPDNDVAGHGLGLGDVLVDEAVLAAEFLENDGTHDDSPI